MRKEKMMVNITFEQGAQARLAVALALTVGTSIFAPLMAKANSSVTPAPTISVGDCTYNTATQQLCCPVVENPLPSGPILVRFDVHVDPDWEFGAEKKTSCSTVPMVRIAELKRQKGDGWNPMPWTPWFPQGPDDPFPPWGDDDDEDDGPKVPEATPTAAPTPNPEERGEAYGGGHDTVDPENPGSQWGETPAPDDEEDPPKDRDYTILEFTVGCLYIDENETLCCPMKGSQPFCLPTEL